MKRKHLLLLPAAAIAGVVLAQGPLTPPGAPAPVMKTLDQIEPRTPISSVPFTISQSGSYYLTRSLSVATGDAITIAATDVTLDLNGFTLSSTAPGPGSGAAILLTDIERGNAAIRNGHICSTTTHSGTTFVKSGFLNGIRTVAGRSTVQVSELHITGMASAGIFAGKSLVERCSVHTCGGSGIVSETIRHCSVRDVSGPGIQGTVVSHSVSYLADTLINYPAIIGKIVESCDGVASSLGRGIDGDIVSNSTGQSYSSSGIIAQNASNCVGTSTTGCGMYVETNASNCEGISNGDTGMDVGANATNCCGRTTWGPYGLRVRGTASFCRGSYSGGIAISAGIAIGCTAESGTVSSPQKHLGTP